MTVPDPSELRTLIDRMADGDRDALRALIEAVGPHLHATIARMVPEPVAAAVLLEESFGEIWSHAPVYDAYAGEPWTWMATVARSRAMEWRVARRAKGKAPPLQVEGMVPSPGSALSALDEADVDVLLRVFHDGLPGGDSGAEDRARFDQALLRLAEGT